MTGRTHVVATAGHVDHGKSTLVRSLTGMEPDRWAEERRRGMTIDLGFAWTTLQSGDSMAFVDVPGHERFVTTMLAGVGPVPAVIFVVAADEGWMPQAAEHLDALEALGVRDGLLVITRSDLLDPALALADAQQHLAGSRLGALPAVTVSTTTGVGLGDVRAALSGLASRIPQPDPAADVRLWVDRAFTVRGAGTVVTGTLAGGTLRPGEQLVLGDRVVSIRGLHSLGRRVDEVSGAARVAVNLRGVSIDAVARGDALLTPGLWLRTTELDVRLRGRRGAEPDSRVLPRELTLHIGSAAIHTRVRPLGRDTARLTLQRALPLRIGDRAVLRDPGRREVAAGATVLDVRPPELRLRGAAARRAAELSDVGDTPEAAGELSRRAVIRRGDLLAMGVLPQALDRLDAISAGEWLLDPSQTSGLLDALRDALAAHDAANPMNPGLPVEAARRAMGLPDARLVGAVLQRADATHLRLSDGRVRDAGAGALPTHVVAAFAAIRSDLELQPFAAPDAERLAALGLGPKELGALVRAGKLLKIDDGVVLLPGADARAVEMLQAYGDVFSLSTARQVLGTSRRVAVPLLELLGRTGRTWRTADGGHRISDRGRLSASHDIASPGQMPPSTT